MTSQAAQKIVDSTSAWIRLAIAVVVGTIGSVGMWSYVVVLPTIQADFGVSRADASLPYTLAMAGFGLGSAVMGRVADRLGLMLAAIIGTIALSIGYVSAGLAESFSFLVAAHVLIGFGSSATFAPLVADMSHWFVRRRGIAVAIAASGNYFAGVVWPPVIQHAVESAGWRQTHIWIGAFCLVSVVLLVAGLRKRAPIADHATEYRTASGHGNALGLSPRSLQILLCIAGLACCVAMAMPQVHIVAYCADLGYGVARGAEMLSLMLAFGIVSRIGCGWIADHIGGLRTLLLSSALQASALVLYVFFDGLASLYVVSALFGLFQGGLVPTYALIVRDYLPPREAGARLGIIILATVIGMALGGWMSGVVFDLTGSYRAAFVNGIGWNLLNLAIAFWLLSRSTRKWAAA
jgi:MFS family permease